MGSRINLFPPKPLSSLFFFIQTASGCVISFSAILITRTFVKMTPARQPDDRCVNLFLCLSLSSFLHRGCQSRGQYELGERQKFDVFLWRAYALPDTRTRHWLKKKKKKNCCPAGGAVFNQDFRPLFDVFPTANWPSWLCPSQRFLFS